MSELKLYKENVYITTFYNPDIFWFVFDSEIENRSEFSNKMNKSKPEQTFQSLSNSTEKQEVVVKYSDLWVRAEIVNINQLDRTKQYVCWLIDYGFFIKVPDVYNLPVIFQTQTVPPFVHKGKLEGLRSIETFFDIDSQKLSTRSQRLWSAGVTNVVIKLLQESDVSCLFQIRCNINGYHIGRVFLTGAKNGDLNSFIVAAKLATEDENSFSVDLIYGQHDEIPRTEVYRAVHLFSLNKKNVQKVNNINNNFSCGRGVFRTRAAPPAQTELSSIQSWIDKLPDDSFDDIPSKSGSSTPSCSEHTTTSDSTPSPKGRAKLISEMLKIKEEKNKPGSSNSFDAKSESGSSKCSPSLSTLSNKSETDEVDYQDVNKASAENKSSDKVVQIKMFPAGALLYSQKQNTERQRESQERQPQQQQQQKKLTETNKMLIPAKYETDTESQKKKNYVSVPVKPEKPNGIPDIKEEMTRSYERAPKCQEPKMKLITGRCGCDVCESWNDNSSVFKPYSELLNVYKKLDPLTEIIKPALLFKTETDSLPNDLTLSQVKISQTSSQNEINKFLAPRLLAHGTFVPKSAVDLPNIPFHADIHQALRSLHYEKAFRVQSFTWPAILRGHHAVLVNVPNSGKTMSYVPAICTFLLRSKLELKDNSVPFAIVICPGAKVAEKVAYLFKNLLTGKNKQKAVLVAVPPLNNYAQNKLEQGVDILVCTPMMLIEILRNRLTNLKRVCHVILEEANELFHRFPTEMELLLETFQKTLQKRTYNESIQMIVTSEEWTQSIEKLCKQLLRVPFICIGSYLEAALYGRADIQMHFSKSAQKPSQIVDIIANNYKIYKTLIVCKQISDMDMVFQYLNRSAIDFVRLDENCTLNDIKSVCTKWSSDVCGKYILLICTDEILSTSLSIVDASIIIQYSLPNSWSQFAYRFSPFTDNYLSPLVKQNESSSSVAMKCKMHVFIDEQDSTEFLKLSKLMIRMKCHLPSEILQMSADCEMKYETNKINDQIDLCDNIKLFGKCQTCSCTYRHLLSPILDQSKSLPQSGLVKFKILHVQDVTTFYGRLLEYTDSVGVVHSFEDQYSKIIAGLSRIMKYDDRRGLLEITVGTVCAVEETSDILRRCRVTEVLKQGSLKRAVSVRIILLDTGSEMVVSTSKLYLLPKHLQEISPQAIQIYLANLGPPNKDTAWSEYCKDKLVQELKRSKYDEHECYCTGRIKLQLGNAFWVDNLTVQEKLNDDILVNHMSFRATLLKYKLVEERPEHLNRLYKLCDDGKIPLADYSLPVVIVKTKVMKSQVKSSWAHLENFRDFNSVYFVDGVSPDLFFVQLQKSESLIKQLEDDIESTVHRLHYKNEFTVMEGQTYLFQDPQNSSYARVLVKELHNNLAECLFVDCGSEITVQISELEHLPDELITKYPFQIIECKLWGVEAKNGNWLKEATDLLYDYALESNSDQFSDFQVKVMAVEQPQVTDFRKYSVILIHNKTTILNNLLVELDLAKRIDGQVIDIDLEKLYESNNNTYEEDEDDEYEDDIGEIRNEIELNDQYMVSDEINDQFMVCDENIVVNDPKMTLLHLIVGREKNLPISSNRFTQQENIRSPPPQPVDYSTPNVIWQQTDDSVILNIQLVDVKECEVLVLRKKIFTFKTNLKGITYKLNLNLFDTVETKIEHKSLGIYIFVKLKKLVPREWTRLVSNDERVRYIKYNVDALHIENDDDDDANVKPNRNRTNSENEDYIFEIASESDETSDVDFGGDNSD